MRILVSYPQRGQRKAKRDVENGIVSDIVSAADAIGAKVQFINHIDYCSPFYSAYEMDVAYRNKERGLIRLYDEVEALLKEFDVFFVVDVNVYHPDFLEKISAYTAFYSFDDPDGAFLRSMPYAYAFDHIFTVTPQYNDDVSMPDQFRKWGAKNATYIPLGVISSQFRTLDEQEIFSHKRVNDIVFVGSATTPQRNQKLFKLKKYFKSRLKIYGQWPWKSNVKNILVNKNPYWIRPHFDLPGLYLHSKIGINIHDSDTYGFGNRRTYELPLNGVMLVCDFKRTFLGTLYELKKEAVGYETIDEAIEQINYYLKHDDERMEIAVNGFRRAKENYLFSNIFKNVLENVRKEISKKSGFR